MSDTNDNVEIPENPFENLQRTNQERLQRLAQDPYAPALPFALLETRLQTLIDIVLTEPIKQVFAIQFEMNVANLLGEAEQVATRNRLNPNFKAEGQQ